MLTENGRKVGEVGMSEEKKYRTFKTKEAPLKEVLQLIRDKSYSNWDEGETIILCPECEEWTHVEINANSGFLDLLGDLIVEGINAEDGNVKLWIKTDEYNWFRADGERK